MRRVCLIGTKSAETARWAASLAAAGFDLSVVRPGVGGLRALGQDPPGAVVIDLSRAPSLGRDLGLALRQRKTTRRVPLVFVAGDPRKTAAVRDLLPDAVYTRWEEMGRALRQAIARPPDSPVVPRTLLAGYAGTPLPKKLGIKPGGIVALVGAPRGFAAALGELPAGARLKSGSKGRHDLAVWFARTRADLARDIGRIAALAEPGGVWIAWPKKGSGVASDLKQADVRAMGLAAGLVDYKICAIDATWSGLKFARRRRA